MHSMRRAVLAIALALLAAVELAAQEGYVDAGNGVQLYYRMFGTGPDTLVVLHGGPGFNMEYLAADFEPLGKSHVVLLYDQRGTGRSTLVTDSVALTGDRFADDLEAVRRHFRLERLNLLGHSWGAGVAALYAQHHPDRIGRLFIVDAIPARHTELVQAFQKLDQNRDPLIRQRMQELRAARLRNPGDAATCRAYYILWFTPFFSDSALMHRSKGDFCAGSPASLTNKVRSVDRYTAASLGEWDWRPILRAVQAPALVIHGSKDPLPVATARVWAAALPKARLVVLPGRGHFPYVEAPAEFFAIVDAFLRGAWPAGAERVTGQ